MIYINGQAVAPTKYIEGNGLDKLAEVTPDALSRSMALPFGDIDLTDYDILYIVGTVNMTDRDWLYMSPSSSTTPTATYFTIGSGDPKYTTISFYDDRFPLLMFQRINGNTFLGHLRNTSDYRQKTFDLSSDVFFVCYNSSNTIATDSTVTIYGRKKEVTE